MTLANVIEAVWVLMSTIGLLAIIPLAIQAFAYVGDLQRAKRNGALKIEAHGNRRREVARVTIFCVSIVIGVTDWLNWPWWIITAGLLFIQATLVGNAIQDNRARRQLLYELRKAGVLED